MCTIVIEGLGLFFVSLALHVLAWRIYKPESYRGWVPMLVVIFGPIAAGIAWLIAPAPLELAAILFLHASLAAVYTIAYTLFTAFSPSIELLKLVDRTPGVAVSA